MCGKLLESETGTARILAQTICPTFVPEGGDNCVLAWPVLMNKRSILVWRTRVDIFVAAGFCAIGWLELKDRRLGAAGLGFLIVAGFLLDVWQTAKRIKRLG